MVASNTYSKLRFCALKEAVHMKEYASDLIRNVAVVSHDGAGKTALVESLLFGLRRCSIRR